MSGSSNDTPMPGGFFSLFNALVDGGWLARLGAMPLKVLLVFLRHADATGCAYPTASSISAKCGIGIRNVQRSLAELSKLGLLQIVDPGGGRRRPAVRRVVIPSETLSHSDTLSTDKPRRTAPPFRPPNPGANRHETPAQGVAKTPAQGVAKPRRTAPNEGLINSTLNKPPTAQGENAGVGGGSVKVNSGTKEARAALVAAGIREPVRTQLLAEIPGLEAEVIQEIAEEVKADGGRGGVLVKAIRTDGARLSQEWRDEEPMRAAEAAEAAQEEAAAAAEQTTAREQRQREAKARERLEAMSATECDALVEVVASRNDEFIAAKIRRAYREGNARTSPVARSFLLGELIRESTVAALAGAGGGAK